MSPRSGPRWTRWERVNTVSPQQLGIAKNVALMRRSSCRLYCALAHGGWGFRIRPLSSRGGALCASIANGGYER